MRNFTCRICFLFLLASCSRFQYLTLSGNNLSQNEQKEFISENDELLITYNFNGYNCPVNISIFNKTNKPVYIDWKKSAIIANGKASSYFSPNYHIDGTANGYNLQWTNNYSTQNASFNANVPGQEGVDFIPPNSFISKKMIEVSNTVYRQIDTGFARVLFAGDGISYAARKKEFTLENSPLVFRSYLTLIKEDNHADTSIKHTFYIKELLQTATSPNNFIDTYTKRGDVYYVSEVTAFGTSTAVATVIGTGVAVGVVAAETKK